MFHCGRSRRALLWLLALSAAPLMLPPNAAAAEALKLDTEPRKMAYAVGYEFGSSLLKQAPHLEADALLRGMADSLKKIQPALSEEQLASALVAFQQNLVAEKTKRDAAAADQNREASTKFLSDNAKRPGVVVLPSGLQYQVLASGKGSSPIKTDRVKVHYHGTLVDGSVFDSSVQRGEPAEFQVGQVIPGWVEALQRMKVGDKWKLFIPPELAYGNRGAGGVIGPGAALIYDVELLDVKPSGAK